jgi:hypothetical protein
MAETVGLLILTAVAGGEVAGIAGLGTFAGTTVAGLSVATIVGSGVLIGGAYAANVLLAPKPEEKSPSDGQVTTKQPVPPRRRHYGRVKVGGPMMFNEPLSGYGGPPQLDQVIAVNHGLVQFEEIWLNEFPAEMSPPLSAGGGNVTNLYLGFGLTPYVAVQVESGTDTDEGFSWLHTWFPSIWDASHQGRGIAKVLLRCAEPAAEDFTSVYTGGQPPVVRAVLRGARVWDPRDGGQDKDNPGTWQWSQNPVLIALDYHRHPDGMRLAHLDSVLFTSAAIAEDWIPAANICDEAVALAGGGTEPRYQANGGYDLPNAAPKDVLGAVFATCDGQTYQRADGAIGVRVGKTVAPAVAIGSDRILGYDGFRKGGNAFSAVNEITAQYTSPPNDYQTSDATAWRDEADISERGQVLSSNINLYWVSSHSQARRLMKIEMHRRNPEWSGRIVTNLFGLLAYNERFVNLQIDELGINDNFEITSFEIDTGAGTCAIGVSSFDQSAYDWTTGEEGSPPAVPAAGPAMAPLAAPTGLAGSSGLPGAVVLAIGDPINLVMNWDSDGQEETSARAQFKLSSADDGGWLDANVQASNVQAISVMVPSGYSYDMRVAWQSGTRSSEWTTITGILA